MFKLGLFLASCSLAVARAPSFLFLLADDIGWSDFGYNNGTAITPNIDAWTQRSGTIKMQDFHSGGTICSPTRASVLTGRNDLRDCIDGVYGCSDMTECVPNFNFAPERTFTIADAARASGLPYNSQFWGKWHLGSFYNDSEAYGGITSSPITHGFDHFNATVEVAPTATTNCLCKEEWKESCLFGHNGGPSHCSKGKNRAGSDLPDGSCFNYWWEDDSKEHAVTNLTWQTPPDDTMYLTDSFERFLAEQKAADTPFMAQISFHNCHMPYIGTPQAVADCAANKTCQPPKHTPYTFAELDFYACLVELDAAVGRVLTTLTNAGYYDDTMIWFTTDNGPEVNCPPLGICSGQPKRPHPSLGEGPGNAGVLRGRKRDIFEGGHRVPGIISYPPLVSGAHESWETVVTHDFLPTVMEMLSVKRPAAQADWALDGQSILPLLKGEAMPERGLAWAYGAADNLSSYGYRYRNWKYVHGSVSCRAPGCEDDKLFDLSVDLGERNDVAAQNPEILKAMIANFTTWQQSVLHSMSAESKCKSTPPAESNWNQLLDSSDVGSPKCGPGL